MDYIKLLNWVLPKTQYAASIKSGMVSLMHFEWKFGCTRI